MLVSREPEAERPAVSRRLYFSLVQPVVYARWHNREKSSGFLFRFVCSGDKLRVKKIVYLNARDVLLLFNRMLIVICKTYRIIWLHRVTRRAERSANKLCDKSG